MTSYRYFWGKEPLPSTEGANAEDILKQLSDMLLRENDISKALDLLKQQGIKPGEDCQGMQGIQDFLEQVRRLKQAPGIDVALVSALEELKKAGRSYARLRGSSTWIKSTQQIQDLMGSRAAALEPDQAIPACWNFKDTSRNWGPSTN
jgi:protoheme ferro-lyase